MCRRENCTLDIRERRKNSATLKSSQNFSSNVQWQSADPGQFLKLGRHRRKFGRDQRVLISVWMLVLAAVPSLVYLNFSCMYGDEVISEVQDYITRSGLERGEPPLPYTVCNGLSNQLLGHAAHIAEAIASGREVLIPDAFIFNGVQSEKESEEASALIDVLATKDNAIPLTQIIDTDSLLQMIRTYGVAARLEPFQDVIARNEADPQSCNWLTSLESSDDEIAQKVLNSLKPSPSFSKILQNTLSNLVDRVTPAGLSPSLYKIVQNTLANVLGGDKSFHAGSLADGICMHHRDGLDWHNHCEQWENIEDGIWRENCLNDRELPLHELVKNRIPAKEPKSWIYYIGDEEPSDKMIDEFKTVGINLIHRKKHALLPNKDIAWAAHLKEISPETHRDLFSFVDFFACAEIDSFIGNSVSTFSATQIARRNGMNSSWYNSRSIPLATLFPVFNVPIVYTYTEESQKLGQKLLKASILSVRDAFAMSTDIHILYHGSKDEQFIKWLETHGVIIHKHEPAWLDTIEEMRQNGDPTRSHLFLHKGNYIGTWQRIDIPLFLNTEYCLLVDNDTIVHRAFGMHDFGLDVTAGIAASMEFNETTMEPENLGVALFNVPMLRETYDEFLEYISDHVDDPVFNGDISDQGAYLNFYEDSTQLLDAVFNVKPYWLDQYHFDERKIVHFHGLKPHDILKLWMDYPGDSFSSAVSYVIWSILNQTEEANVCLVMQDFSRFIAKDMENLNEYCSEIFEQEGGKMVDICWKFFTKLSGKKESDASTCFEEILYPLLESNPTPV